MCEGAQGPNEQADRCLAAGCVCPRHHVDNEICIFCDHYNPGFEETIGAVAELLASLPQPPVPPCPIIDVRKTDAD